MSFAFLKGWASIRLDKGKPCGKGWIAEGLECRLPNTTLLSRTASQDIRHLRYAKRIAEELHGRFPVTQKPMESKSMSGLPLRILTGERRGFFVGDRPLPTPHRKGNFQYAQTGSASVSVLGEDVKAMVDPTPQPVATGGKFWTANAFRKNSVSPEGGNWQWDSSGFQTAAVRHTSRPGNGSPAILSVSPGGSGEHFYALSFDTGRSPATLSYNPLARSEPRSFVGGQGQLVLGNPVGVIRNRKSKYPVYDRIQVRSQIPNESSIVRTEKNT